jgi:uncharacterized membrane protein
LLTGTNVLYLVVLLQPLLWVIPWRASEIVFMLPYLMINLLAGNPAMKNVGWHYNVTVGMFLIVASIFAVTKWGDVFGRKWEPLRLPSLWAGLFLCLSVTSWTVWLNVSTLQPRQYHEAQLEAIQLVPNQSSVIAPETMVAHVSSREKFHTLLGLKHWGGSIDEYEYVVLDSNDRINEPLVDAVLVQQFVGSPSYRLVYNRMGVLVFQRVRLAH